MPTFAGACNNSSQEVGQGGSCFQATDCLAGLICAPQKNGARICTNDLSSIQTTEEAGGRPTDAGDATTDRSNDGPADSPGPDTNQPDTMLPPDAAD